MIIANPIYDIIFKRLMENKRIAGFFIQTLIGEQVIDIAMMPQEYTYLANVKKENKEETYSAEEKEWEILSLIRLDFVALIRTAGGEHKKILIELQKSNNATDLMRFRTYLGEQYKRMDVVEVSTGKVEKSLPVICIYLLGFKLPEGIEAVAIKVGRSYTDIIGQTEIKQKSTWIESLTHDGYFVQIPYINGKPRTLLEQLLSVFEQKYFIDDKSTIKEYEYPIEDETIKMMIDILRHAAADGKTKREMEEAWWAEKRLEELEKTEKELEKAGKELEKSKKTIEENKKMLAEKDKSLAEKDKEIEELRRRLENNFKG